MTKTVLIADKDSKQQSQSALAALGCDVTVFPQPWQNPGRDQVRMIK
jgi:hypothetical protein